MTPPERAASFRRIVAEGAVQGVGYREFTRRAALRLNVSGWVRNRSDGAVEALARGELPALEALIAAMRQGPRFAVVERLSITEPADPSDDDGETFVIRPTV